MAPDSALTRQYMKDLTASQQGELDAVPMYRALADIAEEKGWRRDAETFRALAQDEARHASVFQAHTGKHLAAKQGKARALSVLFRVLGRARLYPLIAKGEYDAAKNYEHLIEHFPDVQSVLDDETRHGNTVMDLLRTREYIEIKE